MREEERPAFPAELKPHLPRRIWSKHPVGCIVVEEDGTIFARLQHAVAAESMLRQVRRVVTDVPSVQRHVGLAIVINLHPAAVVAGEVNRLVDVRHAYFRELERVSRPAHCCRTAAGKRYQTKESFHLS